MGKGPKFSLIVPVYNVSRYLRRCLDSLSVQDYDHYEVICVNDGSTDDSGDILNEYAGRSHFKVITQENRGLGGARNTGLAEATGDYIWCIDSDDWIAPDALSRICKAIEAKPEAGVVMVDLIKTYEGGRKDVMSVTRGFKPGEVLTCESLTRHLLLYEGLYAAQTRIFRADILNGFRFSQGFYEDIPLITLFAKDDFPVIHLQGEIYYYFQRPGSIMQTTDKRILDVFKQFHIVNNHLKDDPRYKVYLAHFFYYLSVITYQKSIESGDKTLIAETKKLFSEGRYDQANVWQVASELNLSMKRRLKLVYYYLRMI